MTGGILFALTFVTIFACAAGFGPSRAGIIRTKEEKHGDIKEKILCGIYVTGTVLLLILLAVCADGELSWAC
jgi:hypothetical protein